MCCGPSIADALPEAVRSMLAEYRGLHEDNPWDWGLEWRTRPLIARMLVPWRLPVALAPYVAGRPELQQMTIGGLTESDVLRALQAGLRYGNALSALKQSSWGDFPWATRSEVEDVMDGSSLRIVR